MLIVDTSVWIDYFNGKQTSLTNILDHLLTTERIAILDVIVQEILQGFQSEKSYRIAHDFLLERLTCHDCLGKENAIKYAQYYRLLRKHGITIRKSNNVMIAGYCLLHNAPLLFADKDFNPFVEHLGLQDAKTLYFQS